MRIVCLSDTHNRAEGTFVPEGDLLLHAGDLTMQGTEEEIIRAMDWIRGLPHEHKVVIAGNHDFLFEREPAKARALTDGVIYLEDQLAEIAGLRIWGSPWQPWFYDWAFNLPRGPEIRKKWDLVPEGVDILLTHGPPAGHGDRGSSGEAAGCGDLLATIRRLAPPLHVFGHIHEGYGRTREGATHCVNASICDVRYEAVNPPIVLDWPLSRDGGGAP